MSKIFYFKNVFLYNNNEQIFKNITNLITQHFAKWNYKKMKFSNERYF